MDTGRALLTDRVAVVTGAGRGLGRGIALGLAAYGAAVVIAERKEESARDVEREIGRQGGRALAVVCDVRDGDAVRRLVDEATGAFGGVDILVNNVGGIYLGRDRAVAAPFVETTEDDWDASYTLNFKTVLLCTKAVARPMVDRGRGGSIINVASSEALRCAPGFALYAAYKAAIVSLTRTLALELSDHGIRVNCLAPDAIPTEGMTKALPELARDEAYRHHVPLGRAGTMDDLAGAAVFLASDLSSFVTGVTLPVEGGMLAAGGWLRHPARGWTTDPTAFREP